MLRVGTFVVSPPATPGRVGACPNVGRCAGRRPPLRGFSGGGASQTRASRSNIADANAGCGEDWAGQVVDLVLERYFSSAWHLFSRSVAPRVRHCDADGRSWGRQTTFETSETRLRCLGAQFEPLPGDGRCWRSWCARCADSIARVTLISRSASQSLRRVETPRRRTTAYRVHGGGPFALRAPSSHSDSHSRALIFRFATATSRGR